jgi:8-oxo-dGTP diphosphatase
MPAEIEVAAGLVFRRGRLLITQRRAEDPLGGLWEFPGGKRMPEESFEACLERELMEELGIEVEVGSLVEEIAHDYPEQRVFLRFYACHWLRHEPLPIGCQAIRWIDASGLMDYAFPAADARLLARLRDDRDLWAGPRGRPHAEGTFISEVHCHYRGFSEPGEGRLWDGGESGGRRVQGADHSGEFDGDEDPGSEVLQDAGDYKGKIDLGIVAVPVKAVKEAVESCVDAGAKAVIVITAGFKEVGAEGLKLERELVAYAKSCELRLLGPNCIGVLNTHHQMNATFAPAMPPAGADFGDLAIGGACAWRFWIGRRPRRSGWAR